MKKLYLTQVKFFEGNSFIFYLVQPYLENKSLLSKIENILNQLNKKKIWNLFLLSALIWLFILLFISVVLPI